MARSPRSLSVGPTDGVRGLLVCVCVLGVMLALTGCSSYTLRGVVISGDNVGVRVVPGGADVLNAPPIEGARVRLTLDPDRLDRRELGTVETGPDGTFAVPIDATGAGVLEYELRVQAQASYFAPVRGVVMLPGSGRRVVVMMRRGGGGSSDSALPSNQDVLEESLRYGRDSGFLKD